MGFVCGPTPSINTQTKRHARTRKKHAEAVIRRIRINACNELRCCTPRFMSAGLGFMKLCHVLQHEQRTHCRVIQVHLCVYRRRLWQPRLAGKGGIFGCLLLTVYDYLCRCCWMNSTIMRHCWRLLSDKLKVEGDPSSSVCMVFLLQTFASVFEEVAYDTMYY